VSSQSAASSAQWSEPAGLIPEDRLPVRMGLVWDADLGAYMLAEGATTPGFVQSGGVTMISPAPDATDTVVRARRSPNRVTYLYRP
jgi:hypothetical protein